MKTKLVAVIALIFCAFMAEASKVEGNAFLLLDYLTKKGRRE